VPGDRRFGGFGHRLLFMPATFCAACWTAPSHTARAICSFLMLPPDGTTLLQSDALS
jgi:hypothetical protein